MPMLLQEADSSDLIGAAIGGLQLKEGPAGLSTEKANGLFMPNIYTTHE